MRINASSYSQVMCVLNLLLFALCFWQKESVRKDLILGIYDGSLNIVVGTHSLLGGQIRYNNLGLLVIDEEQVVSTTSTLYLNLKPTRYLLSFCLQNSIIALQVA